MFTIFVTRNHNNNSGFLFLYNFQHWGSVNNFIYLQNFKMTGQTYSTSCKNLTSSIILVAKQLHLVETELNFGFSDPDTTHITLSIFSSMNQFFVSWYTPSFRLISVIFLHVGHPTFHIPFGRRH